MTTWKSWETFEVIVFHTITRTCLYGNIIMVYFQRNSHSVHNNNIVSKRLVFIYTESSDCWSENISKTS